MKTLKRRTIGLSIGFLSMLLLVLVCATSAFADGGGNLPVNGGTLAATVNPGVSFYTASDLSGSPITSVTLTGADQDVYIKIPVTVVDPTGTGAGWSTKLYGAAFTASDSSGHTLATPSISAYGTVGVGTDSTPTLNATSNASARGTTGALGANSGSANTILTADATYGMGTYTVVVTLHQVISASAFADAGGYTTTYNLDIA